MNTRKPTTALDIKRLIYTCRNDPNPDARELAARTLYLQGGADALEGQCNRKFNELSVASIRVSP